MSFGELFPATSWVGRVITHKIARRIYLFIILLVFAAAGAARVSSLVLIRRIHRVLAGLEQLQIDRTTEAELLRTVPYLERNQYEWRDGFGFRRSYNEGISNASFMWRVGGPLEANWRRTLTDWIGFRSVNFSANVELRDGKVSRVSYGIFLHHGYPWDSVYVTSFHGIWARDRGVAVSSVDDESPQYHVAGDEKQLRVEYAFDGPPNVVSHTFDLHLACLLSLRGCKSTRDLAPVIWADKEKVQAAALARLKSDNPCPDRILPGRVKYLPNLDLLLLKANRVWVEKVNEDGQEVPEWLTDFSVMAVLEGQSRPPWNAVRSRKWISSPLSRDKVIANRESSMTIVASQVLMFSHEQFASCSMVPVTPSALAAVRGAKTPPRLPEDEFVRAAL